MVLKKLRGNFLFINLKMFVYNYINLNNSLFYNEYSVVLIFLLVAILLSVIIISLSYFLAIQNPETEKNFQHMNVVLNLMRMLGILLMLNFI